MPAHTNINAYFMPMSSSRNPDNKPLNQHQWIYAPQNLSPLSGNQTKVAEKKKKTVDTREGSAWGSCRKGSSALMIAVIYIHLFNTNIVIIAFLFCYIYPKFHPHKYSFQPPGSVSLLNGIVYVTHLESTLNMLSTGFVFFQRRNILADPYLV